MVVLGRFIKINQEPYTGGQTVNVGSSDRLPMQKIPQANFNFCSQCGELLGK